MLCSQWFAVAYIHTYIGSVNVLYSSVYICRLTHEEYVGEMPTAYLGGGAIGRRAGERKEVHDGKGYVCVYCTTYLGIKYVRRGACVFTRRDLCSSSGMYGDSAWMTGSYIGKYMDVRCS